MALIDNVRYYGSFTGKDDSDERCLMKKVSSEDMCKGCPVRRDFFWKATSSHVPPKMFALYENPTQLLRCILSEQKDHKRCFYEIITSDRKPYFDFDLEVEDIPSHITDCKEFAHQCLSDVLSSIIQVFRDVGVTLKLDKDILLYAARRPDEVNDKYSYHIVINNYYQRTVEDSLKLFNSVNSLVSDEHKKRNGKTILDGAVYSKNRMFRLLHCTKYDSDRVKDILSSYTMVDGRVISHPIFEEGTVDYFTASMISRTYGCTLLPEFVDITQALTIDSNGRSINVPSTRNSASRNYVDREPLSKEYRKIAVDIMKQKIFSYNGVQTSLKSDGSFHDGYGIKLTHNNHGYDCIICNRKHSNENPYLAVSNHGNVYFHCRRAEDSVFIGTIEQLRQQNINEEDEEVPNAPRRIEQAIPNILYKPTVGPISQSIQPVIVPQQQMPVVMQTAAPPQSVFRPELSLPPVKDTKGIDELEQMTYIIKYPTFTRTEKRVISSVKVEYIESIRGVEFNPKFVLHTRAAVSLAIKLIEEGLYVKYQKLHNMRTSNLKHEVELATSELIRLNDFNKKNGKGRGHQNLFGYLNETNNEYFINAQILLRSTIAKLGDTDYAILEEKTRGVTDEKSIVSGNQGFEFMKQYKNMHLTGQLSSHWNINMLDVLSDLFTCRDIRSYDGNRIEAASYSGLVFNPTQKSLFTSKYTPEGIYEPYINSFTGAIIIPKIYPNIKEEIAAVKTSVTNEQFQGYLWSKALKNPIMKHLWYACEPNKCNKDNVKDPLSWERFIWVLTFFREMLVYKKKVPAMLILCGDTGSGKSTILTELVRKVLGGDYVKEDNNIDPNGRFNYAGFEKILAWIIDDGIGDWCWKDARTFANTTKAIITNPFISIESKGIDKFCAQNFVNVMMAINDPSSLYIPADERRYMMPDFIRLSGTAEGERILHASVSAIHNNDKQVISEFLSALDNFGLTQDEMTTLGVDRITARPDIFFKPPPTSEIKRALVSKSLSPIARFKQTITDAVIRGGVFQDKELLSCVNGRYYFGTGDNMTEIRKYGSDSDGELVMYQNICYSPKEMYDIYKSFMQDTYKGKLQPESDASFTKSFNKNIPTEEVLDGICCINRAKRNSHVNEGIGYGCIGYSFTPGRITKDMTGYHKDLTPMPEYLDRLVTWTDGNKYRYADVIAYHDGLFGEYETLPTHIVSTADPEGLLIANKPKPVDLTPLVIPSTGTSTAHELSTLEIIQFELMSVEEKIVYLIPYKTDNVNLKLLAATMQLAEKKAVFSDPRMR